MFESLDGYRNYSSGTGTAAFDTGNNYWLKMFVSATNDESGIMKKFPIKGNGFTLPTNQYGQLNITLTGITGSCERYLRWYSSNSLDTAGTGHQIGIHVSCVAGTTTVYTSSGDGTTEQSTTISAYSFTNAGDALERYAFSYDGTTISFYINGVLKNTHATHVPQTSGTANIIYGPFFYMKTTTTNTFQMWPGSWSLAWPMLS
jgi:hypothetical protein